jgi:peptidyl-prolyl cis-trans isomerase SurA
MAVLCCWGLAGGALAQTRQLEGVVAIVDDDIILASEYQDRMRQVTENLARQKIEMPPQEVLARQVLDRLILERIQLRMGDRAGVRISDEQLNEALTNMARQNGASLKQFRAQIEADGGSYAAVREQVRQEMILSRVQQGNVRNRVQVTEQEVDDYLASEEGQKRTAAVYHIGHLLLPLATDATMEQERAAMAYMEGLRSRLASGTAFERFMRAPDKTPYAFTGGDLGWRLAGDLPSVFLETVPALETGAISAPVRSASGLHLVKLFEKRGGSGQMTQQTRVRHILIKPSEVRSDAQAQQLATQLRARVLAGEDFATLAREFSEDIGLGARRRGSRLDQRGTDGSGIRAGHEPDRGRRDQRTGAQQFRLARAAGRGAPHPRPQRRDETQPGSQHPVRPEVRRRTEHVAAEDPGRGFCRNQDLMPAPVRRCSR